MRYKVETSATPRPDKVCSRDESRPVLTRPYLRLRRSGKKGKGKKIIGGMIEATDSYKLVRLPVEFEEMDEPTEGPVPREAFGAKSPMRMYEDRMETITKDGWKATDRPDPNGSAFPNVDNLVGGLEDYSNFLISLNARYLWELAQAMGEEQVVLIFKAYGEGKIVSAPRGRHDLEENPKRGDTVKFPDGEGAILVLPGTGKRYGRNGGYVDPRQLKTGPMGLLMPVRIMGVNHPKDEK